MASRTPVVPAPQLKSCFVVTNHTMSPKLKFMYKLIWTMSIIQILYDRMSHQLLGCITQYIDAFYTMPQHTSTDSKSFLQALGGYLMACNKHTHAKIKIKSCDPLCHTHLDRLVVKLQTKEDSLMEGFLRLFCGINVNVFLQINDVNKSKDNCHQSNKLGTGLMRYKLHAQKNVKRAPNLVCEG